MAREAGSASPGPAIVLVHGGAHGAWCWEPLLAHLATPALAVDLPGRGATPGDLGTLTVADFAASVLADADRAGRDRFVLVGHSLGGLTITEVARVAPGRVAALVFVSCAVPPEGRSVMDTAAPDVRDLGERARTRPRVGRGAGLDEATARAMFCNDMDDEQARFVLDRLGAEAEGIVWEPVTRAGIPPSIPKTWVRLLQDRSLPPSVQDASVRNLEDVPGGTVEVVDLDAGHDAMVSRPAELAAILERVVATVPAG